MREKKRLYHLFNQPKGGPDRPKAEADIQKYYDLVHVKLPPQRLRRISLMNIILLLGILAVFFLCALLIPKPTESKIEKRQLAQFPQFTAESFFDGDYTKSIGSWFADTFPMRDFFVGLSSVMDESKGIRFDGVRIIAPTGDGTMQDIPADVPAGLTGGEQDPQPKSSAPAVAGEEREEEPAPTPEAVFNPPDMHINESVGPISNGIFVANGRALSLFGGSDGNAKWYAEVLNSYHEELPDVQIYDMIIPTAVEFYVPDKYKDMTQSQKRTMDLIYENLDPGIKRVDAYSKLAQHADEYIYFRTDHHWTGLGAYYAYTAFCEQAGLTPLRTDEFETRRLDNFIGTMYAQSKQDSTLLENPDYVDYYIFKQDYEAWVYKNGSPYQGVPHNLWGEYAVSPNSYSVFLQGDFPMIEVHTGLHTGRKIMVVKESFGNAFAPFLINHYDEVYIVDQRYFDRPAIDMIREKGINELIFANNSFAACTPYHIRCIDGMRHHTYYYYTPPQQAAQPAPTPAPEVIERVPEDLDIELVPEKPQKKAGAKASSEEETSRRELRIRDTDEE